MDDNNFQSQHGKTITALLIIAILLFPLLVVNTIQTDNPQPFIFKAKILRKLDETMNGKLQYYLVQQVKGVSPATEFVVTIDRPYTRGKLESRFRPDRELWMQGSLMTRDVYYGDQYLFFDYPQLYISQIKGNLFWPDQITELGILYRSPITSILSLVIIWTFPFQEEFTLNSFIVLIMMAASVAATLYLLVIKTKKPQHKALLILAYYLISMILTVPILTDLF